MSRPKITVSVETLLANHSPEVRAICEALRQIVKIAVPEATEKALPGWHAISYRHPKAGYFCGVFPQEAHVRVALEHGASLPDPDGLLEIPPTSGKQVRYIEIDPGQVIPEGAIVALLREAIRLKA